MGNALSYNNSTTQLKTSEDTTILNKYVNRFFKELPHEYANSEKIKIKGISVNTQKELNELYKNPMRARACCLNQQYVPIALPYVYPYKKDGGFACGNNNDCKSNKCGSDKKCTVVVGDKKMDSIKTTYPKIEVFKEGTLPRLCGSTETQGFFKYNNKNIKMYPAVNEIYKYTEDTESRTTLCKPFIGTVDFNSGKSSGIGICDKVIEDRKLSKPDNELYQFYGDAINGNQEVRFIDQGNIDNFRTVKTDSNNAYPECSCTNSVYIRTPVIGDNGTKLDKMQTHAMQQYSDSYCFNADGNAFVSQIEKKPISLCVNIQSNINALADGGSKINMNQSCSAKTEVTKETNVDKMDGMDDEDQDNDEVVVIKKQKEKEKTKIDLDNKTKDRLREKEISKSDEEKAKEVADAKAKIAADAKAVADAKAKIAADAKAVADAKAKIVADARISLNKKKAALKAIESAKTNNMIMIGGGISLVVVIIFIVLMSSGGNIKKNENKDEDEDE